MMNELNKRTHTHKTNECVSVRTKIIRLGFNKMYDQIVQQFVVFVQIVRKTFHSLSCQREKKINHNRESEIGIERGN